jgi:hypothetical protein
VNYDLLLYWALMQREMPPSIDFDDGFREPDDGPAEYVTWDVQKTGEQNVFYLHGGLHIFDAGSDYLDSFRSTADFIRMRTWMKQTSAKIEEELGRKIKIQTPEEEAVGFTLEVAYGFEHAMTKKVLEYGLMVGCLFPDAIGWTIVPAAHDYGLEKSPTFKSIYRPLLTLLDEKYGNNNDKHSRAIKAELAAHIKCEFLSAS